MPRIPALLWSAKQFNRKAAAALLEFTAQRPELAKATQEAQAAIAMAGVKLNLLAFLAHILENRP